MVRNNKQAGAVLLKFGVALALSLGGIIYSVLRTGRIKPSQSPPWPPPPDTGNLLDTAEATSFFSNSALVAPEKDEELITHNAPSSIYSGEKDGFLLPEFDELVRGFHLAATKTGFSPKKDTETTRSDAETQTSSKPDEREDYEHEIKYLKNMVKVLREREMTLEVQLLEYCSLKEQNTALMELQNRVKINNVEAKFFSLKIESLQADNRRLEAQVADYAKIVGELEAERAKVKPLMKKSKSETEHNKEQILALQQKVKKTMLEEQEAVENEEDIRLKLQRLKDVEEEAAGLRKTNRSLQLENSHLSRKLDYTQMLASSVLEDHETEALKGEALRLRQQNDDFSKKIEQLEANRCADVEELVYLRWINACLRYELRNFQPGHGKTVARDLSKTLSPKSEEKAKQLILEYANKEGFAEKGITITDYDFDQWSSSHSYVTDSGELDDTSFDNWSNSKTVSTSKTKKFSKLKRLIRGKDSHHHSRSSSLEKTATADGMMGVSPRIDGGNEGLGKQLKSSSLGSSRLSLDLDTLRMLQLDDVSNSRNSDGGPPLVYKSIVLGEQSFSGYSSKESTSHENPRTIQKSELLKYALVLKDSSVERTQFRPRTASHASF